MRKEQSSKKVILHNLEAILVLVMRKKPECYTLENPLRFGSASLRFSAAHILRSKTKCNVHEPENQLNNLLAVCFFSFSIVAT